MVDKEGATEPEQNAGIAAKLGGITVVTVIFMVVGVAHVTVGVKV